MQSNQHKKKKQQDSNHNTKNLREEDSEKQDLLQEIQDLELEILDLYEVIFYFAGLQEEYLENALRYYTTIMESQDENLEYSAQSIIHNILQIKKEKPQWFHKS